MKIVIADDDPDDRNLASIAFKELKVNHGIDFVTNGQELIDYLILRLNLKMALPDLILLDLNMPKKNGKTALEEIKSNPDLRHLDIIIFSTSASDEDKNHMLDLGAKNYIVKPFGYAELLNIFRNICDGLHDKKSR
jgi:CheY-like chemotaxis protein